MNGFLDTDGNMHECQRYEHLDIACEIVEDMGVIVKNSLEAEDYLLKLGWVEIRTRDVYSLIGCFKNYDKEERYHLTDAQKQWLNAAYSNMTTACRESVDEMFDFDR